MNHHGLGELDDGCTFMYSTQIRCLHLPAFSRSMAETPTHVDYLYS